MAEPYTQDDLDAATEAHQRAKLWSAVEQQVRKAYRKHGRDPWGRHEFYGVLKEEIDELWDVIKADGPSEDLLNEMLDVMAVCQRYAETRDRYRERKLVEYAP